jgi:hypothetical protein
VSLAGHGPEEASISQVQKYAFHIFGHHIKTSKALGFELPASVKPAVLKCTTYTHPP